MAFNIRLLLFDKKIAIVATVSMYVLVAFHDYITGNKFSMSAFYLIPILLATLNFGRKWGYAVASICGITERTIYAILGVNYPLAHIFFWNTVILTGMYVFIAWVISEYKESYDRERITAAEMKRINEGFIEAISREHDRLSKHDGIL